MKMCSLLFRANITTGMHCCIEYVVHGKTKFLLRVGEKRIAYITGVHRQRKKWINNFRNIINKNVIIVFVFKLTIIIGIGRYILNLNLN